LPPISEPPKRSSGLFGWLLDPSPERFLLPATGLLIVGLDWLLFPKEAATLLLSTPITAVLGFLAGSFGTYHLQRNYAQNTKPAALLKAVLAGLLVGVPFPLAGTLVGGWVLATSGLHDLKNRLWNASVLRK
jgi:hypothetical protein